VAQKKKAVAKKTLSSSDPPVEGEGEKDPAAVSLGRRGGLKGGPARAKKLTPEQRSESARKAVLARWAKERAKKSGGGSS
jgi:hypothetical protein